MCGVVQPGVANVYCAVTQHSRNGATFYLETFPSMTGREYRSPHCFSPHLFPSKCLLSCLAISFAICDACLGTWADVLERCLCTADSPPCFRCQHSCRHHRYILIVHSYAASYYCHAQQTKQPHCKSDWTTHISHTTSRSLAAKWQAVPTLNCCAGCL